MIIIIIIIIIIVIIIIIENYNLKIIECTVYLESYQGNKLFSLNSYKPGTNDG